MNKRSAMHGESGYERRADDAYWTPEWCVECLLDHIEPRGLVWEPAVGTGNIARCLRRLGFAVEVSDIRSYDYDGTKIQDFLTVEHFDDEAFSIITNPPYVLAEDFVRHALNLTARTDGMVAMLLRNEWDCAASRKDLFVASPFTMKVVLTRRPRWSEDDKASPRHNFAWFVWDWQGDAPTMRWAP